MASESYNVAAVRPAVTPPTPSLDATATARGQAASGRLAEPSTGAVDAGLAATETPAGMGREPVGTVEQVAQAVDRINEMMQNGKQTLSFQLDDDSGRMVVRVTDAQTKEVIRQIPTEETLKFAQYVDGLVGLIFNKKA
ncbi:flagellar protein FlaG [Thiocystis violacea]|uniref:flagellar protein FlaG n=1 Tax=Thiocystis violacea TaxID=13725 RepID=UPI001907FF90|nr:flagellar protein FlaG [Thiocystis violacea]MBK1719486.1 flagellar biosynthesis protein FlaG [Thiocystis violacea]